jgi:putative flippase GtrA
LSTVATRWRAFVLVGIGGFAVQLVAVTLLARTGFPDIAATGIAVELAILHNFVWHERWTWRAAATARPAAVFARLLRFNGATAVVSILGNVAIAYWLVRRLHLPLSAANAVAVGALSVVNFLIADRRIWGTCSPPASAGG